MPDADGRFKGILVPEFPWLQEELKDKERRNGLLATAKKAHADLAQAQESEVDHKQDSGSGA